MSKDNGPSQQKEKGMKKHCFSSFKKRKPRSLSLDCTPSNQGQSPKNKTKQKSPQSAVLSRGTVFTFENEHLLKTNEKSCSDKSCLTLHLKDENQNLCYWTVRPVSYTAPKKKLNMKVHNLLPSVLQLSSLRE